MVVSDDLGLCCGGRDRRARHGAASVARLGWLWKRWVCADGLGVCAGGRMIYLFCVRVVNCYWHIRLRQLTVATLLAACSLIRDGAALPPRDVS